MHILKTTSQATRSRVAATILFLQTPNVVLPARWRHATGAVRSYFSCASRILRFPFHRPPGVTRRQQFQHHLPCRHRLPKRCCSKALNAYRLNTRISVWSRLTSRRSSRHGGYPRVGRASAPAQPTARRIAVFRVQPVSVLHVAPVAVPALPSTIPVRPSTRFQPSTLPASFPQAGAQPQRQPRHPSFSGCACGSSARASSPGVCAVACCRPDSVDSCRSGRSRRQPTASGMTAPGT